MMVNTGSVLLHWSDAFQLSGLLSSSPFPIMCLFASTYSFHIRLRPYSNIDAKREGWLFPSKRAKEGHLTTVAKRFREARRAAGLPEDLVLYCARHTFGTAVYEATGNLAMVMKSMGHADARTAMHYQHPTLDPVREAIDQRNLRHSEYSVQ